MKFEEPGEVRRLTVLTEKIISGVKVVTTQLMLVQATILLRVAPAMIL